MNASNRPVRLVVWGTYDLGKPRTPIMLKGLQLNGVHIDQCHFDVWKDVADKSQVTSLRSRLKLALRWLLAYPRLIYRYLRLPAHDAVLVCYMGQLDVLIMWPLARLRGVPIIWDAFLSLHDTVVNDRRLLGRKNPLAYLLYAWEWLACRAADRIIVDTNAHCDFFARHFHIRRDKFDRVLVGADDAFFSSDSAASHRHSRDPGTPFTVLFYGQFIPLHGIRYIVQAAALCRGDNLRWILIGKGQQSAEIRSLIDTLQLDNLTWIEWVPYEQLHEWIMNADCCLGIFGDTEKASRVIPNKAYQVLAVNRPLITMDSAAARELLDEFSNVTLVPPACPSAIADAVRKLASSEAALGGDSQSPPQSPIMITPVGIGRQLIDAIDKAVYRPGPPSRTTDQPH